MKVLVQRELDSVSSTAIESVIASGAVSRVASQVASPIALGVLFDCPKRIHWLSEMIIMTKRNAHPIVCNTEMGLRWFLLGRSSQVSIAAINSAVDAYRRWGSISKQPSQIACKPCRWSDSGR